MSNGSQYLHRTIVFSGPIYQNATKLLRNSCCVAVNEKVSNLTILLSSDGGNVDDGFALYGFLRALPLELTMHNVGMIGSIANAVFLAGHTRYASPHSVFLFHDFNWRYSEAQNIRALTMTEHSMILEGARTRLQSLFDLHAKKDDPLFHSPNFFKEPRIHDPATAKAAGIIHDVKDAAIPAGTVVYNTDWS